MRSLLIASANERGLAEALESGADAIVADLAGTAAPTRAAARAAAARFLQQARGKRGGPVLIVGANALHSGETDADLKAIMAGAPDAILLPGSLGAPSVQQLSAKLAVREAQLGLSDGATGILAVVDTAEAFFNMGSYRGASARLIGIAWNPESLRAEIGAETDRDPLGAYLGAYRLARELTLLAATTARVGAIDAAFAHTGDLEGLRAEAIAARRDGFTAKMAIDRAQVAVINEIFPRRTAPVAERGA